MHVVSTGHEIELSVEPNGMELGGVHEGGLIQGLLLLSVVAPPALIPPATQFSVVAQETDASESTEGWSSCTQLTPFCVPMMAGFDETNPTATHVLGPGQETLDSESNPAGCT
jgi:hypothetical protein